MEEFRNLICGVWVEGTEFAPNINPSNTNEIIGNYARSNASGVDQAVAAAEEALPAWSGASPQVRHDVLEAAGAAIVSRKEELGALLSREEGCSVSGGEVVDGPGYYQRPATFSGATNDMRVSREEIFGPCASVIKATDYNEALSLANDTEFGLSAGICTTSLKHASDFRRNVQAGMVMVNVPTAGVDCHVPFGGRKGSSYGPREQGSYAREFYTTVKTSYVAP